jgi:hypothetical protein
MAASRADIGEARLALQRLFIERVAPECQAAGARPASTSPSGAGADSRAGVSSYDLGARIEDAVNTAFGLDVTVCRAKSRTLLFNLKQNAELRRLLVSGELPLERFVQMTPEVRAKRAGARRADCRGAGAGDRRYEAAPRGHHQAQEQGGDSQRQFGGHHRPVPLLQVWQPPLHVLPEADALSRRTDDNIRDLCGVQVQVAVLNA